MLKYFNFFHMILIIILVLQISVLIFMQLDLDPHLEFALECGFRMRIQETKIMWIYADVDPQHCEVQHQHALRHMMNWARQSLDMRAVTGQAGLSRVLGSIFWFKNYIYLTPLFFPLFSPLATHNRLLVRYTRGDLPLHPPIRRIFSFNLNK